MSVTKISNDNIETIDVSKLTGSFPAIDGSSITGIVGGTTVMKAASDPANDTNPADGVGTMYLNTTDGNMFICMDATTDQNEWNNVGPGTGGVAYVPFSYQGSSYGYSLGGHLDYSVIQKFSFTSDTNSVSTGNLLYSTYQAEGSQSATHGFYMRGYDWGSATNLRYEIQKFSFVSEGNAVDTGFTCFLKSAEYSQAHSSTSTDGNHCYIVGGFGTSGAVSSIQRFSFDISANTIDVGDIQEGRGQGWGWSNGAYGYCAGGNNSGNQSTVFKFSFAAAGVTSTNVGALTVARRQCHGQGVNSTTHGYVAAGEITGGNTPSNIIDRMSFASEGNAIDHGDLHTSVCYGAGNASSTTHGYVFGGMLADFLTINKIQKFAYASNNIASDSADLTATSNLKSVAGCQN